MTIRQSISNARPEPMTELTPAQYEITRQLQRLDSAAAIAESTWGIGTIEVALKIHYPELLVKWESQKNKINAAIQENDSFSMPDLVDGAIRAYRLFDEKLRAAGCTPRSSGFWAVGIDGVTYVVVNNYMDACAMTRSEAEFKGCVVLTLEELIRVYHKRTEALHTGVPVQKADTSAQKMKIGDMEDEIPW